jgi:hypothetical protein
VLSALQGVRFIAQHIKDADKDNEVSTVPWLFDNVALYRNRWDHDYGSQSDPQFY